MSQCIAGNKISTRTLSEIAVVKQLIDSLLGEVLPPDVRFKLNEARDCMQQAFDLTGVAR